MYLNVNNFAHLPCDSDMIQAAVDKAQEIGQAILIPKINQKTG